MDKHRDSYRRTQTTITQTSPPQVEGEPAGSDPEGCPADSGSTELVGRTLAVRRRPIRQTPSRETNSSRITILCHGKASADVKGRSVGQQQLQENGLSVKHRLGQSVWMAPAAHCFDKKRFLTPLCAPALCAPVHFCPHPRDMKRECCAFARIQRTALFVAKPASNRH